MPHRDRVMICGSRSWTNEAAIRGVLVGLEPETVVMLGGARGADEIARVLISRDKLPLAVQLYLADWQREGKRAGILRNLRMLDDGPDEIHAFWDGRSRGTNHVIGEATKRGFVLHVHLEETLSLFA